MRYQLIDTATGEIGEEFPQWPARREVRRSESRGPSRTFIVQPAGYWYRINRIRHYLTDTWRTERYRKAIRRHYRQRRQRHRQAPLSEVVWALGIIALLGGAVAYYKSIEAYVR